MGHCMRGPNVPSKIKELIIFQVSVTKKLSPVKFKKCPCRNIYFTPYCATMTLSCMFNLRDIVLKSD